jgi:N-acetylglucosaminyldiphosphoundecaprenol N-acetyl-beta-D-mannosaminyltransferase
MIPVSRPAPRVTEAPLRPSPVRSVPVLGIPLALIDYERTLDWIDHAVAARRRGYICVAAVHTVMATREDAELRSAVLGSDLTVPDGQPLVWALKLLGHPLEDRVYGP